MSRVGFFIEAIFQRKKQEIHLRIAIYDCNVQYSQISNIMQ